MRAFVRNLGELVAVNAQAVVIAVVAFTIAMVGLASMAQPFDNSQASFAPQSPELDAATEIRDRFSDQRTLVLQVLVTTRPDPQSEGGPILTAEGFETVRRVEDIVREGLGDLLVQDEQRPGVLSFASAIELGADAQGFDPSTLDDEGVRQIFKAALEFAPQEQAELLARLLGGADSPDEATTALMVATIDAGAYVDAEFPEKARAADQLAVVELLEAEDFGSYDVLPFSFVLLQADDASFLEEVQRLFGLAIMVVLLVLAGVLRARRGQILGRPGAIRRTLADTALGLGVVVLANIWVAGLQTVMGPDGLGFVGAPSPPTNIVSILLIALGVDYAIHLQGRYRDEIGHGASPEDAVRRSAGTVGSAILLGALTTAVGFLTNLTSPLAPIRDLGVLAAVGLVSAFVLTTTFLPAVRSLLDQRAARKGRLVREEIAPTDAQLLPRIALAIGGPALRRPVAVIVAGAIVTAMGAGAITQLKTEFEIAAFLPEGSDNQKAFILVNDEFAGGLGETTSVLLTGDVASTEAHNAQVEALALLTQSEGVVTRTSGIVGQAPPLVVRDVLAAAAVPGAPAPLVAAADAAIAAGARSDGSVEGDVADVYAALAPTGLLDAVLDLEPEDGLAPAVRWSISTQTTRVGAKPMIADFATALAPVRDAGLQATTTSDLIINDTSIDALQSSQMRGLAVAFVAVLALLTVVYGRRLGRWDFGLLLMIPVAAVAICTLGLMALTGIPFDPVTATVSALVIGVGIDFTIHLGERFVEDLHDAGNEPVAALRASIQHTGSALAGSALTTVLGFAVLTTGSLVPFQRLGSTTVYAVGLSLFAVVALQPAILLVWARKHEAALATMGTPYEDLAPREGVEA